MILINDACIDLIKKFEGLELKAYFGKADKPGIYTIGYGTIQYPPFYMGGKMVALEDPTITAEIATSFLMWEVQLKSQGLDPLLRDDLSPNQFAALISFAYNLGTYAFKGSTLRLKVNSNPHDPTIRNEFEKWVHANGKRVQGLVNRRKMEADLYFTV